MRENRSPRVIQPASLRDYFRQEVRAAMQETDVEAHDDTQGYLAGLLARFTRSERLFDRTRDGMAVQALADCYADAVNSPTPAERCRALRRMGDVALFVAGVLPDSLRRKAVDVDYYVAMGGGAYASLSESPHADEDQETSRRTYGELASKFVAFMDVLSAVSDSSACDDRDLLRLYELWLKTGSRRAERQLRRAGIAPLATGSTATRRH